MAQQDPQHLAVFTFSIMKSCLTAFYWYVFITFTQTPCIPEIFIGGPSVQLSLHQRYPINVTLLSNSTRKYIENRDGSCSRSPDFNSVPGDLSIVLQSLQINYISNWATIASFPLISNLLHNNKPTATTIREYEQLTPFII